jgi:hypothetical protein
MNEILFSDVTNLNSYWQSTYDEADLSPPADDALITVGNSLARFATRLVSSLGNNCSATAVKLLSVTSYHNQDTYRVIHIPILFIGFSCALGDILCRIGSGLM